MYEEERRLVENKVRNLVKKGRLEGRRIYLFGVSDSTRQIIGMLRESGLEPAGVLDNDLSKRDSYCSRVKVAPAGEIGNIRDGKNLFLIYSIFWREMAAQLESLSVRAEAILCLYKKRDSLWRQYAMAGRGRGIYKRLQRKYGKVTVFICPYTGTGDVYLIGAFWRQYLEAKGIRDYVFVVIGGACKKVAGLFDIKNVEALGTQDEGKCLIKYYMLCPGEADLKILNDGWRLTNHGNPLEWFRGYKGLYFTEMFRKFVFGLPDDVMPQAPVRGALDFGKRETNVKTKAEQEVDRIFCENHLIPGRTVALSPYTNTLADLPDTFWNMVVQALKKRGYVVCTNSSGGQEPAVKGTAPVFFPLDIAPQFISRAGYFIGVRSGFCDVVSSADAKKIILYDRRDRFFLSSAYEYFSLNHMGLCGDAVEIEFDNKKIKECMERIMGEFREV